MNDLFGNKIQPMPKSGIRQRDYKRNKCSQCGEYPKIHRTNSKKYYCKCHGYCYRCGWERKTALFDTPQAAVDCWNNNNQKEQQ